MRYQVARVMATVSLLVGFCGGAMLYSPPFLVQRLLQRAEADAVVMMLALGAVASLTVWAREPGHRDRLPLAAALISIGVLAVTLNVLAPRLGWWGGRVFEAPLVPLALVSALTAMSLLGSVLLLYRWIAARRPRLAVPIYLVIMVALVPATVLSDPMFLRTGALTFGGGYTIAHDVLLGEVGFALPLVLYELFRRCLAPSERT